MATKKTSAAHDVVVLGRTGHGQDFREFYHVNKFRAAAAEKEGKPVSEITIEEAKADAIKYIREHRAGAAGMDYRIKDLVTGAILD